MTLLYEQRRRGPATHALVIGVGGYEFLKGGSGRSRLSPSKYGNLGQLTSPPVSACAFAQMLMASKAHDWAAPLGTIDLLISTAPGQPDPSVPGGPYKPATRQAIQDAFDEWWSRCNEEEGNVAVFYFCGHGLQATNQILLASDFGRSVGNPWATAFDFNRTRQAFRANRAHVQIFLVDACREITTSTVEVPTPNAPPLREPERRDPEHCRHDLTVQATSRTKKAYGNENEVSFFAAAILGAMRGDAAKRVNGEWWITSDAIASRIKKLVQLAGGDDQTPGVSTSEPVNLYRLGRVPEATLELGCNPDEATFHADLACWPLSGGRKKRRHEKAADSWSVPLPAGFYGVSADFAGGQYQHAEDELAVDPPVTPLALPVR